MRIRFVLASLALLVASCAAPISGEVAPSPTSTPLPSGSATSSPTPSPEPTERPIGAEDVVATTAEHLRVRVGPGTAQESVGVLALGTVAFVLGDAVQIEGIPWYPLSGLSVPPFSGCGPVPDSAPLSACPAWRGWVAGTSPDGDAWLARVRPPDPCPEGDIQGLMQLALTYRLICFGHAELSFNAYWPTLPDGIGLGPSCGFDPDIDWLLCHDTNPNVVAPSEELGREIGYGFRLSIHPDSGVAMPKRGQWVQVTGHFDDPAAQRCADATRDDSDPVMAIFVCRLEFVPTSVQRTWAP